MPKGISEFIDCRGFLLMLNGPLPFNQDDAIASQLKNWCRYIFEPPAPVMMRCSVPRLGKPIYQLIPDSHVGKQEEACIIN
ncbi:MAG: hypothetical protein REI95_13295 [Oxalicibacterium faecigallinarum]|uniref:hypothetical protein n=1 Tax=Oxalicibacterium faecigallinarum TaxID=573741 RepID=UPI0028072CC0|nr:hypothetical protein [Oxalicibacterium faecigallinarum]MDQ7970605.1 hypothetical protein [Oxalicibacterium faecigallinarum]